MSEPRIDVLVKSSSRAEPYTISFYLIGKKIKAFCSCPAGDNRLLCKHVIKSISGEREILFDDSQLPLLHKISDHFGKSDYFALMSEWNELKSKLESIKRAEKLKKKELSMALLNE